MLIRYHLVFYAIGYLLMVMGMYVHSLFYFILLIYIIWLFFRLSLKHLFVLMLVLMTLLIPRHSLQELPEVIEGRVVKVSENYCYVKTEVGIIKLFHQTMFSYNDHIVAKITPMKMNENTNDYAFNEKQYLYSQHIFYKAQLEDLKSCISHPSLYHLIEKRMSSSQDIQDYQRLFLFGERSEDIQDDYQQLSHFSLVHLFALSGMHVHILYMLLKKSFGMLVTQGISKYLSFLCLAIYIFSVPSGISLQRAFFVLLIHSLVEKWFHELDVLSFLIIVSLLYNPYLVYNVSFIFSYFVYFIVLITRRLKYSWLLIYMSSIPIVLSLNYQIPLTAFLIGNLLTPFIEVFYCLCLFSIIFPFTQELVGLCVIGLRLMMQFLEVINHYFIFSRPSFSFVIMFYVLFFLLIYQFELKRNVQKTISMIIALMISFSIYSQYKIYGEITMIDVGQGDCTLIRMPFNQGNILIDTGGNKDYDLATKTIIPYLKAGGIRKLDYVYISHDDFDHSGALSSLEENFQIDHVMTHYEKKRRIGDMTITMLETGVQSDINDNSLVMRIDIHDFSLLMTGDISTSVEKQLIEKYKNLNADILKVSHHGSSTASSSQFINAVKPKIAMIGVKEKNLYHHPSPIVIDRLKRKNITILRTDEDGMFHIRFYAKSRYIFR